MKLYNCQPCGQLLFFENTVCEKCGHRLGFLPETTTLSALEPADGSDTWYALAGLEGSRYKFCANAVHDVCNWVLPAESNESFCVACRHNRTIPIFRTRIISSPGASSKSPSTGCSTACYASACRSRPAPKTPNTDSSSISWPIPKQVRR